MHIQLLKTTLLFHKVNEQHIVLGKRKSTQQIIIILTFTSGLQNGSSLRGCKYEVSPWCQVVDTCAVEDLISARIIIWSVSCTRNRESGRWSVGGI